MLRRSFLSRFSAATAAFGLQPPQPSSTSRPRAWEAAHHEQDEWLADNAAKHRVIFDTWNAERFPDAVQFAGDGHGAPRLLQLGGAPHAMYASTT